MNSRSVATLPWRAKWPNPAESSFNYYRFLKYFKSLQKPRPRNLKHVRIAIIGAGIAGLTAARELYRYGFNNIHVFEATARIGGRLWSEPATRFTAYELGAMRMPFFREANDQRQRTTGKFGENSVLAFYAKEFDLARAPFPNPGTCKSGIYIADPRHRRRHLHAYPDDLPDELLRIDKKWKNFQKRFQDLAKDKYARGDPAWRDFWKKVLNHYGNLTFRQLVFKSEECLDPENGNFGGLGMNEHEADLFYVVGAGDGGWGAFYEVSALYVIRTMLLGFGEKLQLILGRKKGNPGPPSDPTDSNGFRFSASYLGIQTLAECMLFETVQGRRSSLYEAIRKENGPRLELNRRVWRVEREDHGLRLAVEEWGDSKPRMSPSYKAVILTVPGWAAESIEFKGFAPKIKTSVAQAIDLSHWISSTKVFFTLKERFWENRKFDLPQTVMTDTFLRAMYGYAWKGKNDPGVLLASYTWEDDANKLVDDDDELARLCLVELDQIFREKTREKSKKRFSELFIDLTAKPRIIRWAQQLDYRGCAKLYRSNCSAKDYTLLTFNHEHSQSTSVYFAGEAFSVEGGWTEPALRTALDAVIRVIQHRGGGWKSPFQSTYDNLTNYPRELLKEATEKGSGKARDPGLRSRRRKG